ncbi:MAG: lytic transglycosylase domain-containing protein [Campylobacteraceae bacterium]|jgi:soluble lytic murein transglycosylase|nr:lytic transglycosylase domain-containing protein [Campylobacteraceae bacterium]
MPFKFLFLSLFFCASALFGAVLSYEELKTKPKSIAKDYYIYRLLLEGNASKAEIGDLYDEVSRMNSKLKKEFAKNIDINLKSECMNINAKNLFNASNECLIKLLTPQFVETLNSSAKTNLADRLRSESNFTANWISVLNSKEPFKIIKKHGLSKEFLKIFNEMPKSYKYKFNFKLDEGFLLQLESSPDYYEAFVKNIVFSREEFKKLSDSLLYMPQSGKLTHQTFFYLGINALIHEDEKLAEKLFEKAEKSAYFRSDADKALFFNYLAGGNETVLRKLAESFDSNIYSLYAQEKLDIQASNVIFLSTSREKAAHKFNMQDPFSWTLLLRSIKDMSKNEMDIFTAGFEAQETLPIYAFLMERNMRYKYHYFIIPFEKYLQDFENERKALILSIARQESRFITSSVSASYALGMMQFMPSVASDIAAKQKIKDFDLDDMFNPGTAYKFANIHLNYLSKYLHHPLFVAYAYNGGIGFTNKILQKKELFQSGKYEPFLSIELLPNAESREYGKKVLANYVIYMEYFDKKTTVTDLLETLIKPVQTDKSPQKD